MSICCFSAAIHYAWRNTYNNRPSSICRGISVDTFQILIYFHQFDILAITVLRSWSLICHGTVSVSLSIEESALVYLSMVFCSNMDLFTCTLCLWLIDLWSVYLKLTLKFNKQYINHHQYFLTSWIVLFYFADFWWNLAMKRWPLSWRMGHRCMEL